MAPDALLYMGTLKIVLLCMADAFRNGKLHIAVGTVTNRCTVRYWKKSFFGF